jgi:hypothetical protein
VRALAHERTITAVAIDVGRRVSIEGFFQNPKEGVISRNQDRLPLSLEVSGIGWSFAADPTIDLLARSASNCMACFGRRGQGLEGGRRILLDIRKGTDETIATVQARVKVLERKAGEKRVNNYSPSKRDKTVEPTVGRGGIGGGGFLDLA